MIKEYIFWIESGVEPITVEYVMEKIDEIAEKTGIVDFPIFFTKDDFRAVQDEMFRDWSYAMPFELNQSQTIKGHKVYILG